MSNLTYPSYDDANRVDIDTQRIIFENTKEYKKSIYTKIVKINAINFSDILYFAEQNGYVWNRAHDILEKIRYGRLNRENFAEDAYIFGYSDELRKIMIAFFDTYDLQEVYLTHNHEV